MNKAPAGLRSDSLYFRAYYLVRQPLIEMMFRGVAWDRETAEVERTKLAQRRDAIKGELDGLTGGFHLYTIKSKTSDEFRILRDVQRALKAQRDAIPKLDKAARKELRIVLDAFRDVMADARSEGRDKTYFAGDGLSDDRIAEWLYEHLGLPAFKKKRKASGKITVTVEDIVLKKIKVRWPEHVPLINLVLEHRRCAKLISTYLNPEKLLNPLDGRFHAMYKPFGTQTLRLSSGSDPWGYGGNAQNQDRKYKWLFVPRLTTERS